MSMNNLDFNLKLFSSGFSFRWKGEVKHMKILTTSDESLFCLSESRYFKSVVELIAWYETNSLAESFSGLDTCLGRAFYGGGGKAQSSPGTLQAALTPTRTTSRGGGGEREDVTSFSFPNAGIPVSLPKEDNWGLSLSNISSSINC